MTTKTIFKIMPGSKKLKISAETIAIFPELQSIGYDDIAIYRRISYKMNQSRLENLQDMQ